MNGRSSLVLAALILLAGTGLLRSADTAPTPLVLQKGDHISIVGNALAELMQHDGWLETLLQSRYPQHQLVIRNLGFAADEVAVRQRTAGFGSMDDYLTSNRTDVVFAFYGFNESFAGEAGLEKFRQDLEKLLGRIAAQKCNGTNSPRIVLFSPIAHEDLDDPNLTNAATNNMRLEKYTAAMKDVAQRAGVQFIDLYGPSQALYSKNKRPLTVNGVHLTEEGNKALAEVIDRELFGARESKLKGSALEKLRTAVLDKNFHWFHRYQTTDGYNVYGGRSTLKFVDDISNRDSLQREMVVLDVMTANRDRRIWALAGGEDTKVDDSNTPAFIDVKSNKPGPGADGRHLYLSGEEAITKMTVAPGMKVNLVASEEKFPEMVNPVQMAFDPKGRLWVAVWPGYPHWKPKTKMEDKLLILEDKDGDGRTDKIITFAGDLHDPTGFEFYGGGVVVAEAPYLLFLKDTDGDDKADVRERWLSNLSSGDTHHTASSFVLDPGGALYFQEGTFHQTQIETPYGPIRNNDACVWRFEPRTWKVERHIPYPFANPHGHVFDRWGQNFVTDGTSAETYHGALFSGHLDSPKRHAKPPRLYKQRIRPCSGTEILSSTHFPEKNQGNLLVGNVIGLLGMMQYEINEDKSSFAGVEVDTVVQSTDQNFRPADFEIGPDGAIYFLDWQNAIIGHMQHHLRDPSRDHEHGRVYRVTYPERPLNKPPKIAGQSIRNLLELLKDPNDRVRYRAKIELSGRKASDVISEAKKWIKSLDSKDKEYEHHMMEGLWVHQYHNVVNEDLLKRMLRSPDHRARSAATRVLCQWRDRVQDPLGLLRVQAEDEHSHVRLEAARACSFFTSKAAADTALLVLNHPMDDYLKFTLDETMKQLDRYLK